MPLVRKYNMTFFTATVLEWKYALKNTQHKRQIVDSLKYMVQIERVLIHAFVIMDNHMHLLWHILSPHRNQDVQRDLLKYTAQQILKNLRNTDIAMLESLKVDAKDRKYQFWERNPLSVGLWTEAVVKQKLEYIHWNPVKAGLCMSPAEYAFSTAAFYEGRNNDFSFVTPIEFRS